MSLGNDPERSAICGCGRPKPEPCLVRQSCWFATAPAVRSSYFSSKPAERQAAIRIILEAARQRGQQSTPKN